MTTEALNPHLSPGSFFNRPEPYFTDTSIDQAYQTFVAASVDGIDSSEVMALLRSTTDFDQITWREARQLYGALDFNRGLMDAPAQEIATRIKDKLYEAYPARIMEPDFIMRGSVAPPLGDNRIENYRSSVDYAAPSVKGDAMNGFVDEMQVMANRANLNAIIAAIIHGIRG
jgi:hypothetical protein